jgi:hypothetical protein
MLSQGAAAVCTSHPADSVVCHGVDHDPELTRFLGKSADGVSNGRPSAQQAAYAAASSNIFMLLGLICR